jgi:hypothetical protein
MLTIEQFVSAIPDGVAAVPVPTDLLRSWVISAMPEASTTERDRAFDLNVADAGKMLGRAPQTVRAWCAEGRIEGAYRRNDREWRIPYDALVRFQESQRVRSTCSPSRTGLNGSLDPFSWNTGAMPRHVAQPRPRR